MVDTEVGLVGEHSPAVRAVLGLMSCPVFGQAGQAEAVSTWYGYRADEDVPTQKAHEVLLGEQADSGGHDLQRNDVHQNKNKQKKAVRNKSFFLLFTPKPFVVTFVPEGLQSKSDA